MDQTQIDTTIALIIASTLPDVDKDYFVAALKRSGLTEILEKEIQTALKTAAVKQQTETEFATPDGDAAENKLIALENERERRTQELDDTFAPRFHALEKQMTTLQQEYDDALAGINTEIDTKLDALTAS